MNYERSESKLYRFLSSARVLELPKGQVIHSFTSDAIHLIKEGYVKRYLITKEGAKSIQVIYGPDDFFPLTPVYKQIFNIDMYSGPEQYYYEALTPVTFRSVGLKELQDQLLEDPELFKDLFYAAGLRLNSYIHRLESMSLGVANKKIAHQLYYLATIFGKNTEDGIKICLPLTHQTIAEILDMARETVTLRLTRLQEKGLISANKQIITVLDLEKLRTS